MTETKNHNRVRDSGGSRSGNRARFGRSFRELAKRTLLIAGLFFSASLALAQEHEKPEPAPSYVYTPAGTFFPREDGSLLFIEGVHVFEEVGTVIQGGVYGAVYSMVTTPLVMGAIGLLPAAGPGAAVAALATFLWKIRTPISAWYSYLQAMRGLWNYQTWRIGRVPVYFSSPLVSRRLLVSWRYPMSDEHRPQLEIIALPGVTALTSDDSSPVEQAFSNLASTMVDKGLSKVVVTIQKNNLVLSALPDKGRWFHRVMPRPVLPLLEEVLYLWQGRQEMSSALSLLTPETINYFSAALGCQDQLALACERNSVKVAESSAASLFLLSSQDNQCDFLEVADRSTRIGGFGGYMHINTGKPCDQTEHYLAEYDEQVFENTLIANSGISAVPYWLSRLMSRALSEAVSMGTAAAWDYVSPFSGSGSSSDHDSDSPAVSEKMESHSLSDTVAAQIDAHGVRCLSMVRPELGAAAPEDSKLICQWRLSRGS